MGKKNSEKSQRLAQQQRKRDERAARREIRRQKQHGQSHNEDNSLKQQLSGLNLKVRDITGDGNCLFRALADQLEGHESNHMKYRQQVVEYMIQHRPDFEPFMLDNISFDRHVQLLSQEGTFAGNDALVAFARFHRLIIVIHQLNKPCWQIEGNSGGQGADEPCELHISYHDFEHYSSVRKKLDNDPHGPADIKLKQLKCNNDKKDTSRMPASNKKKNKSTNNTTQKSGHHSSYDEDTVPFNQDQVSSNDNATPLNEDQGNSIDNNTIPSNEDQGNSIDNNNIPSNEDQDNSIDNNTIPSNEDQGNSIGDNAMPLNDDQRHANNNNTMTLNEDQVNSKDNNAMLLNEDQVNAAGPHSHDVKLEFRDSSQLSNDHQIQPKDIKQNVSINMPSITDTKHDHECSKSSHDGVQPNEIESEVMQLSNCLDIDLIREALLEHNYNLNDTIAYIMQITEVAEQDIQSNQPDTQDKKDKIITKKLEKSQPKSINPGSKGRPSSHRQSSKHLSNRRRKELAKKERLKRRDERRINNSTVLSNGQNQTPDLPNTLQTLHI